MKTTGSLSVNQIYQRTNPGVVDIKVTTSSGSAPTDNFGNPGSGGNGQSQQSQAEGSGFVIDGDGHIVDEPARGRRRLVDHRHLRRRPQGEREGRRHRLLDRRRRDQGRRAEVRAAPADLRATPSSVTVGYGVVAIGSPFGLEGTVTSGIVSALNRTIQAPNNFTITGAIQTDAAINHGNSGGPLLDANGNVIGINAQIESDSGGNDGVGFAIPSTTVQRVAQQLISSGKVAHAYLGVQLGDGSGGATVGQVASGAPAADAGVRNGDVVTAIDGKAITSADALVNAVDAHKPGDTVTLKVKRGGSTNDVKVKLGTRPN